MNGIDSVHGRSVALHVVKASKEEPEESNKDNGMVENPAEEVKRHLGIVTMDHVRVSYQFSII